MILSWMAWMQHIKKGEIYLANLGNIKKEDIGKIRPVLIFQNNLLNRMLSETTFNDVIVIPLSSQIVKNDFSYIINKRDRLQKDSTILCNAIKMINAKRLKTDKGYLTKLNKNEIKNIENILYKLFDCDITHL